MSWTLFVSIFLGTFIGRLVSDYLFKKGSLSLLTMMNIENIFEKGLDILL